jgi:ABC-2 type transport system permease protein
VLILLEAVIAFAFAALGSWAALRTGSTEAVQGLFPVFFVFLFLSSMNMPRNLIQADWFRWVATVNPVSYLVEAARSLVIQGWNWEALGLGFAAASALSLVGFALSTHALYRRLERT